MKKSLVLISFLLSATAFAGEISDRVLKNKKLLVGVEPVYAPFTFKDEQGNQTGFDVEVIKKVGEKLGWEVKFKPTPWGDMFFNLEAKSFDVIANQIAISEKRLALNSLSDPYCYSQSAIIVKKGNNSIKSLDDVKDKIIAAAPDGSRAKIALEHGSKLIPANKLEQALHLVHRGRADYTINDNLAFLYYLKKYPKAGLEISGLLGEKGGPAGFATLKEENKLIEELNKGLKQIREDGTLKEISMKYFGKDITVE